MQMVEPAHNVPQKTRQATEHEAARTASSFVRLGELSWHVGGANVKHQL